MSKLLTVAEAADRLSVSKKTVYDWFESGKLPGTKLGRCVRIDEDGLAAFIEAGRNGGPAPAPAARRSTRPPATPTAYRYFPPSSSGATAA